MIAARKLPRHSHVCTSITNEQSGNGHDDCVDNEDGDQVTMSDMGEGAGHSCSTIPAIDVFNAKMFPRGEIKHMIG